MCHIASGDQQKADAIGEEWELYVIATLNPRVTADTL
jgi:hypothetical protein